MFDAAIVDTITPATVDGPGVDPDILRIVRLKHLVHILENAPPGKFFMHVWLNNLKFIEETPVCGTSACALGWAALDPQFRQAGLSIASVLPYGVSKPWYNENYSLVPAYNNEFCVSAGAKFFKIEDKTAILLFTSILSTRSETIYKLNQLIQKYST